MTFFCRRFSAAPLQTNKGFVVLAGSDAAPESQASLSGGYRAPGDKLMAQGVLVDADGKKKFTQNQLFSSPSQAACVVVGYSINGRDACCTGDGPTLSQLEAVDMEKLKERLGL